MIYTPSDDSFLIAEHAKKLAFGNVLEVGTGSGYVVIQLMTNKNIKEMTAIDINKEAIDFCKKNIMSKKIKFMQSDLFSIIKGKDKFDTIIFNPPYLPEDNDEPKDSALATTGGKKGYEIILRFLDNLNDHLEEQGICLLLFSSLSKKDIIDQHLDRLLFNYFLLEEKNLFFEKLYVYKITKSDILKKLTKNRLTDMMYMAKGKRGHVYSAIYDKKKVAVKIKNPKSTAIARIEIESQALEKAGKLKIGPKLYKKDKDFIIMEYIEGEQILDRLKKLKKQDIIMILKDIIKQCKVLDDNNLQKEEMHHPVKHIIITKANKPVMIDFERLSYTEKPHNITQLIQFLTSRNMIEILKEKNMSLKRDELTALAKRYKGSKEDKDKITKELLKKIS